MYENETVMVAIIKKCERAREKKRGGEERKKEEEAVKNDKNN